MSKVTKKVEKWLVSVIQPQYLYKDVTYHHIYHFLVKYLPLGFKIRTAVFTSDLGYTQLLINLHGTLQTRTCPVPLSIWVPHNYPYAEPTYQGEPNGVPVIYVVPTTESAIRPGNNVDAQGKVYHPYLAQWHSSLVEGANEEFLLVRLMDRLAPTFDQAPPLGSAVSPFASPITSPGPQLPPKPQLASYSSQTTTPKRELGGPAVPVRPALPGKPSSSAAATTDDLTPAKYRAPPPLPGQGISQNSSQSTFIALYSNSDRQHLSPNVTGQSGTWSPDRSSSYYPKERLPPYDVGGIESPTQSLDYSQPVRSMQRNKDEDIARQAIEVEDLMDRLSVEDESLSHNVELLEKLAAQINMCLDAGNTDSLNGLLPQVNEYSARIEALNSQLVHQNNQAQENEKNLKKHVDYMLERIATLKDLNSRLEQTERLNAESPDAVYISPDRKVRLDDLATLDLILLHQLYDVCTDIKAYKDAISLVGGNFKAEPEIINDSNLDNCVKAIRSLSRELFWLEATRGEIAKVMSLDS